MKRGINLGKSSFSVRGDSDWQRRVVFRIPKVSIGLYHITSPVNRCHQCDAEKIDSVQKFWFFWYNSKARMQSNKVLFKEGAANWREHTILENMTSVMRNCGYLLIVFILSRTVFLDKVGNFFVRKYTLIFTVTHPIKVRMEAWDWYFLFPIYSKRLTMCLSLPALN